MADATVRQIQRVVDLTQAAIFNRVRVHYQKREQLKLVIGYRRSLYRKVAVHMLCVLLNRQLGRPCLHLDGLVSF
ncbi:MAG: hypothetical protein I8H91_03780 [Burkholderiales bacterium]|nr:hypothetical protein [Burkholderiales bacterium]